MDVRKGLRNPSCSPVFISGSCSELLSGNLFLLGVHAGLGLGEASVIMEEINRSGGNAGACHGQMYNMGTLLRHGNAARPETARLDIRFSDLDWSASLGPQAIELHADGRCLLSLAFDGLHAGCDAPTELFGPHVIPGDVLQRLDAWLPGLWTLPCVDNATSGLPERLPLTVMLPTIVPSLGASADGWRARAEIWRDRRVIVDSGPPIARWDLPGGGERLYAESVGVTHVFVGGTDTITVRGATAGADTPS